MWISGLFFLPGDSLTSFNCHTVLPQQAAHGHLQVHAYARTQLASPSNVFHLKCLDVCCAMEDTKELDRKGNQHSTYIRSNLLQCNSAEF